MPKRPSAGQMRSKIVFQRKGDIVDPFVSDHVIVGGGDWVDQYTCAARLQPKFGGDVETFAASRLSSKQPYNLTVRNCAAARAVRTDWRVKDARVGADANGAAPRVFAIKTIVDPLEDGAWLEMLVVEGDPS